MKRSHLGGAHREDTVLEVEFVRLEGPRLHLERSADGRITISKLLLKVLGAKGDSGDSAGSATLPILRVQGGSLDWIDRGAAGDPIELHLHPLHGGSAGHGTSGATLARTCLSD